MKNQLITGLLVAFHLITPLQADWIAGRDMVANEIIPASEAVNPNPIVPEWTYGFLSGTGFTAFNSSQHSNVIYGPSVQGFFGPFAGQQPLVSVNSTGAPLAFADAGVLSLDTDEMLLHPGPNGERATVRWIAPKSGNFSISAVWQDINLNGGDGADGSILKNGTQLFLQAWNNGDPALSHSIPLITLIAGDVIDFTVGRKNNYFSDSTKFDATIRDLCGYIPIANGGFEAPVLANAGYAIVSTSANLPGWTVVSSGGGHLADKDDFTVTGTVDEQYLELARVAGDSISISQTVSGLTAGNTYTLAFEYGNPYTTTAYRYHVLATAGGVSFSDSSSVPVTGVMKTGMIHFTATGPSAPIAFSTSNQADSLGVALDNIRVFKGNIEGCECFEIINPKTTATPKVGGGYTFSHSFSLLNESENTANALLIPPSLVTPPGVTVGPATLPVNIPDGAEVPVSFTINGATAGQEVCFTVILMNYTSGECCRKEICVKMPCLTVTNGEVLCENGVYVYSPTVINLTGSPVSGISLIPDDPTTTITPAFVPLNSLASGSSLQLPPLTVKGAQPSSKLCFTIVLYDTQGGGCCFQRHCVDLPDCTDVIPPVVQTPNGTPAEPCSERERSRVVSPDGKTAICHSKVLCNTTRVDCWTWSFEVTNLSPHTMTHLTVPFPGADPAVIQFATPLAPGQAAACHVDLCGPGISAGVLQVPIYLVDTENSVCTSFPQTIELLPCRCLQVVEESSVCVRQPNGAFCHTYTARIQNLSQMGVSHLFLLPASPSNVTFQPSYFDIGATAFGEYRTFTTTICNAPTDAPIRFTITVHNDDFSHCCAINHGVTLEPCCDCEASYDFVGLNGEPAALPPGTTLLNVVRGTDGKFGFGPQTGPKPFPYVYMAASGKRTMVRIDANTGIVLGEYSTGPQSRGALNPSRTTVDRFGECWVGNRDDNSPTSGSVMRLGLVIGGIRGDKTGQGTVNPNPNGQYLQGPFTYVSPSVVDRDGDGLFKTSRGIGNVLPWGGISSGAVGNDIAIVNLAEDELIVNYVRVLPTGVRAMAIDKSNDLWVGGTGGAGKFQMVLGATGDLSNRLISLDGGYGCLIDEYNVIWSVKNGSGLHRYDLTSGTSALAELKAPGVYGIGISPCDGNIWTSSYGSSVDAWRVDPLVPYQYGTFLRRWTAGVNGTWQGSFAQPGQAQGLCVDANNNVWVSSAQASKVWKFASFPAHPAISPVPTVATFGPGNVPNTITGPTGCAIDHQGNVWVSDKSGHGAARINTTTNLIDHFTAMGASSSPYNYSDMTGYVALSATTQTGFMQFQHDSLCDGTPWGRLKWATTGETADCGIKVEIRVSDDAINFPSDWLKVDNSKWFCSEDYEGRYIQVRVSFTRPPGCTTVCDPRLCSLDLECCIGADVNLCPVIVAQDIQTEVNAATNIGATATDPEGTPLTATIQVNNGFQFPVTVAANGRFELTNIYFGATGVQPVVFRVSDGVNTCSVQVNLNVGDQTPPVTTGSFADVFYADFGGLVPDFWNEGEVGALDDSGTVIFSQDPPPRTEVFQGSHVFRIIARDPAGNESILAGYITVLPMAVLSSPANYEVYPAAQNVPVSFTPAGAPPLGTTYDLIDNGISVYRFPVGVTSLESYRPSPGAHTLSILVTAPDGRTSTSGSKGIVVSGTEPSGPTTPSLVIAGDTNTPSALSISCVAPQGKTYDIQKSHDLIIWETIDQVTGNGQVSVIPVIIDPVQKKAFFRMVEVTR